MWHLHLPWYLSLLYVNNMVQMLCDVSSPAGGLLWLWLICAAVTVTLTFLLEMISDWSLRKYTRKTNDRRDSWQRLLFSWPFHFPRSSRNTPIRAWETAHGGVIFIYTHKAKAYRGLHSDPNNRDLLTEKVFALGPPVDQRVKRKVKKTTKL